MKETQEPMQKHNQSHIALHPRPLHNPRSIRTAYFIARYDFRDNLLLLGEQFRHRVCVQPQTLGA